MARASASLAMMRRVPLSKMAYVALIATWAWLMLTPLKGTDQYFCGAHRGETLLVDSAQRDKPVLLQGMQRRDITSWNEHERPFKKIKWVWVGLGMRHDAAMAYTRLGFTKQAPCPQT